MSQHEGEASGPTASLVTLWLGGGALGVVLVLGILTLAQDQSQAFDWLQTLVLFVLGGTSVGTIIQGKRTRAITQQVQHQTNGSLDRRIEAAVRRALEAANGEEAA